jgi:ribonuclease P protein component
MQNKPRNTFPKAEHLFGKTATESLFARGTAFIAYPVRVVFLAVPKEKESDVPARLMVSAPKKRFKHAVDRNRVKRQIREAYRLNKHILADIENSPSGLDIAFIWLTDKHQPSQLIATKLTSLLDKIVKAKTAS